ncbi:MAG: DUF86 domain-containing protein [Thermosynechococcaceae cyanobacterium]
MRDDREKLRDILEAFERIERYIIFGQERFETDELVQTWFIQHLQIIGEASRSLSTQTRALAPDIPWKQIIGMRNTIAHTYFNIDLEIIWSTAIVGLPVLKPQIQSLLDDLNNIASQE